MPRPLTQDSLQKFVFVSFGFVLARGWFYDFGTWILSLGLVLFGFRKLSRALRNLLRIVTLIDSAMAVVFLLARCSHG